MKVDILEQLDDGSQRRIATFEWRDGALSCDNPVLWRNLMNATGGVITGARGKRYSPEDGVEYLRSLRFHFAGPYLFAGPPTELVNDPSPARKEPASKTVTRDFSAATPRAAAPAVPPASPTGPASPSSGQGGYAKSAPIPGTGGVLGSVKPGGSASASALRSDSTGGVGGSAATGGGGRSAAAPSAAPTGRAAVGGSGGSSSSGASSSGASGAGASGAGAAVGSAASGGAGNRAPAPASTGSSTPILNRNTVGQRHQLTDVRPESPARDAQVAAREQRRKVEDVAPGRDIQERLYGCIYRLLNAFRALALDVLVDEADAMMVLLSELARVDLEQVRRTMEADEDFKELRFLQGNRTNYPRAVDRLSRYIQKMMEPLTKGEVADSLGPLYALREGAAGLKQARDEWRSSHGMDYGVERRAVCTTAVELQEAWAELGLPAFRRRGLSTALLEELFKSSLEPLRDAIKHFQSANLGEAESALRLALRQDPGNLEARLLLGDLLRRLDRLDDAVAELDRLIELEHLNLRGGGSGVPRSSTLLHLARGRACMGRVLLSMGLLNPAVDQLERGLDALDQHQRRYPDETLEHALRGRVRAERETLHWLLEPLCRSVGDEERAQHHRHLRNLPS